MKMRWMKDRRKYDVVMSVMKMERVACVRDI